MAKNIAPRIVYPVGNGYVNDLMPMIHGTGEPGASIQGMLDGTSFSSTVSEDGVWCYKTENELANQTEHTLTIVQQDSSGNFSPQVSVKFRADTQLLTPHTVLYPANNQFINSCSPLFHGNGKPGATIELRLRNSVYRTMVNSEGTWQVQAENLPDGFSSMQVLQKDMGNLGAELTVNFIVDTIAPPEPALEYPRDQSFINTPKPMFRGKGEPHATIDATVDEKKYTTRVTAQGDWSFEASEMLIDEAHMISTRQRDQAGNISTEKVVLFTIKTKQPSPPYVTCPKSGEFLRESYPTLKGRGEANCTVEARICDKVYSTQVNSEGQWELRIRDKLADAAHSMKLCQKDSAGNVSPNADLTIQIDTVTPAPPVILYPEKGGYVNQTSFTVKGTGEPDAAIECTVAGKDYTARVGLDGSWSVDTNGDDNIKYKMNYSVTAKQIDLAGNTSPCAKSEFKVDTEILKAPGLTFPADRSVINMANPVLTGTGKPGATVRVCLGSQNYTVKVPAGGNWSLNIGALSQGEVAMELSQTDCGNVSPTAAVRFSVKLAAPAAPVISSPAENMGLKGSSVTITGTGEVGATVHIRLDNQCYTANVMSNGSWEYTVSDLLQGIHSILASQTDPAGNESSFACVNFVSFLDEPNVRYGGNLTSYQIFYNPEGPEFKKRTVATLVTNNPITVNNVFGNIFSMILSENGVYDFNYKESGGNSGAVSVAVTWIDNRLPVIQIECNGNIFFSDKTVSYQKTGGACIKYALLNGMPFESGKTVTDEGTYRVEICDQAGNLSSACFVIDKTPPAVPGVESNKVYNTDVTVSFSDNVSKIKSAMLNGQNILSGAVLTANGDYTLTVTDFADNCTESKFKIQK